MSIIATFEGPKGVGKSTILKELVDNGFADRVHAFAGDWNHLITEDQIELDHSSSSRILHDRGMLSHFIYTFIMPADPDYNRVKYNGAKIEISTWRVPNIQMFKEYLDKIEDKLYILYAKNVDLLSHRIAERDKKIGKGATDDEMKVLEQSNLLYKQIGEFLKAVFPDKVEIIEIDEVTTVDEILERMLR